MSLDAELGERKEVRTPEWRLRYYDRGEGEPIVFLHGLVVNPLIWRKVVPELAGSYRCIAPVLPLGSVQTRPVAATAMLVKLLTSLPILTATGTLQDVTPEGTTKAIWSRPVQQPERPR